MMTRFVRGKLNIHDSFQRGARCRGNALEPKSKTGISAHENLKPPSRPPPAGPWNLTVGPRTVRKAREVLVEIKAIGSVTRIVYPLRRGPEGLFRPSPVMKAPARGSTSGPG